MASFSSLLYMPDEDAITIPAMEAAHTQPDTITANINRNLNRFDITFLIYKFLPFKNT